MLRSCGLCVPEDFAAKELYRMGFLPNQEDSEDMTENRALRIGYGL